MVIHSRRRGLIACHTVRVMCHRICSIDVPFDGRGRTTVHHKAYLDTLTFFSLIPCLSIVICPKSAAVFCCLYVTQIDFSRNRLSDILQ